MKKEVKKYLNDLHASGPQTIGFSAFILRLIACVEHDGGRWFDVHKYFELPIMGKSVFLTETEVLKWWREYGQ